MQAKIKSTALEVSRWMFEFSLYYHFCMYEMLDSGDEEFYGPTPKTDYFCKFFRPLQRNSGQHPINAAYARIREEYHLPWYNESNKANIIIYAGKLFHTNLKVNITEHAEAHVRKFLKQLFHKRDDRKGISQTLHHLFRD